MIVRTYVSIDAIDYLEKSLLPQWRDDLKDAEEEQDKKWIVELQADIQRMEKALSIMNKYENAEVEITDLEAYSNLLETLNEAAEEIEGKRCINSDGTAISIWLY